MAQNQINTKEQIKVLTALLKQENLEREYLSKELHHKAGGIAIIKMYLKSLYSQHESVKRNETIQLLDDIIQTSLDELRIIMDGIYPRKVQRIGLVSALLGKCDDFSKKDNSKINLASTIPKRLKINWQQEIEIYRLCVNILDYFCIASTKLIACEISQKQNFLVIQVFGKDAKQDLLKNTEAITLMSFIKARIFLIRAIKMSKTNWRSVIAFKVQIIPEEN
jgi:signal transduction histidine kinase